MVVADLARLLGIAINRSSLESEPIRAGWWVLSGCLGACPPCAPLLKASEVLLYATEDSCACGLSLEKEVHSRVRATPARKHAPPITRGGAFIFGRWVMSAKAFVEVAGVSPS